jgi:hypothetical protein
MLRPVKTARATTKEEVDPALATARSDYDRGRRGELNIRPPPPGPGADLRTTLLREVSDRLSALLGVNRAAAVWEAAIRYMVSGRYAPLASALKALDADECSMAFQIIHDGFNRLARLARRPPEGD